MKVGGPLKVKAISVGIDMFMYCCTYIIGICQDAKQKLLKKEMKPMMFSKLIKWNLKIFSFQE